LLSFILGLFKLLGKHPNWGTQYYRCILICYIAEQVVKITQGHRWRMELRSGHVALSAASTPPQGDEPQAQTESAITLGPSILPSQLSASEALRMLDSEFDDDTELLAIADTLVSLGAPPTCLPPPLPVPPPQWANSAPTPAWTGQHQDLTHVYRTLRSCQTTFITGNTIHLIVWGAIAPSHPGSATVLATIDMKPRLRDGDSVFHAASRYLAHKGVGSCCQQFFRFRLTKLLQKIG